MQRLVVFQKKDRKLVAAFKMNTIITDMDVLVIPGMAYKVTLKTDIFYKGADGQYYVK